MSGKSWGGARAGAGRKKGAGTPKNAAFEGAQTDYGRTFIYMPTTEAGKEMQSWDRNQLLLKSRWLTNNYGIASGSIATVVNLAIGTGLIPQARSKNRTWNQTAEDAFEAKCGTAAFGFDVAAQVNFYEAQPLILKSVLTDGDFFAQLMRSETGAGMARFIGGEFCQTGTIGEASPNSPWWDGVLSNRYGRAIKYRFLRSLLTPGDFTDIPAEDVIHIKRHYRSGYVRGVPVLRHAVNHLHDMTDILSFTKGSFKLASQIAFLLESAEAGKINLGSNLVKQTVGDGQITRDRMYPLAGVVQQKPGEKITTLQNPHPGQSFEPFMEFLIRDIAAGFPIHPEIIWNMVKAGGANMRGILAIALPLFEELRQMLINQFCRRFWVFWIWHEIEAGRLTYPGDDWWRHDWIPPRNPTVDFTKDGKLLADLCDRGLLSPDRYYAMQGLDAETEDETTIRRAARRKKMVEEISKAEGVDLTTEEVFPPAPGATNVQQQEEEPEKKPKPEEEE